MQHNTTLLLIEVGALLLTMSLLGRLSNNLGISPIPFYLILGLTFGNGGLLGLEDGMQVFETGYQIGIILLLLMLGLEFTSEELVHSLKTSRIAGIVDALLNAIPGAAMGFLLGWGPIAALALAGVTWVSSSGVVAKILRDLGRLTNRETPVILSILVIEDLAMAGYLPILTTIIAGLALLEGAIAVAIAIAVVSVIIFVALRWGNLVSKLFSADQLEPLLLGVLGLVMLVAGIAEDVKVSSAVGAFLVGIALSGKVAHNANTVLSPLRDLFAAIFFVSFGLTIDAASLPGMLLPALGLAIVTIGTKLLTGIFAAKRAGIGRLGQWRTGLTLGPRGEFSIVVAGIATSASSAVIPNQLGPLVAAYVLITIIVASLLARLPDFAWFKNAVVTKPQNKLGAVAKQASQ